jgi:hypothetical protein
LTLRLRVRSVNLTILLRDRAAFDQTDVRRAVTRASSSRMRCAVFGPMPGRVWTWSAIALSRSIVVMPSVRRISHTSKGRRSPLIGPPVQSPLSLALLRFRVRGAGWVSCRIHPRSVPIGGDRSAGYTVLPTRHDAPHALWAFGPDLEAPLFARGAFFREDKNPKRIGRGQP